MVRRTIVARGTIVVRWTIVTRGTIVVRWSTEARGTIVVRESIVACGKDVREISSPSIARYKTPIDKDPRVPKSSGFHV